MEGREIYQNHRLIQYIDGCVDVLTLADFAECPCLSSDYSVEPSAIS
jgi:hypothetical protein